MCFFGETINHGYLHLVGLSIFPLNVRNMERKRVNTSIKNGSKSTEHSLSKSSKFPPRQDDDGRHQGNPYVEGSIVRIKLTKFL